MTTLETRPSAATTAPPARKPKRRLGPGALTIVTWVIAILFVFPLLWMILTAFKQEADAYTDPPKLFFTPTFDQIANVLEAAGSCPTCRTRRSSRCSRRCWCCCSASRRRTRCRWRR